MSKNRIVPLVLALLIGLACAFPAAADDCSVSDHVESAWAAIVDFVVSLTGLDDEENEGGLPDIQPVPDPIG